MEKGSPMKEGARHGGQAASISMQPSQEVQIEKIVVEKRRYKLQPEGFGNGTISRNMQSCFGALYHTSHSQPTSTFKPLLTSNSLTMNKRAKPFQAKSLIFGRMSQDHIQLTRVQPGFSTWGAELYIYMLVIIHN